MSTSHSPFFPHIRINILSVFAIYNGPQYYKYTLQLELSRVLASYNRALGAYIYDFLAKQRRAFSAASDGLV